MIGTGELGTPEPKHHAAHAQLGPLAGSHNTIGNIFYGSKGYMAIGDEDACTYKTWLGTSQEPGPSAHAAGNHYANFIDCVRSRKREALNAPIEEAYISAGLVHLANASYRLSRALHFDPKSEQVIGDDEATQLQCDADRGYRQPFAVPEEI